MHSERQCCMIIQYMSNWSHINRLYEWVYMYSNMDYHTLDQSAIFCLSITSQLNNGNVPLMLMAALLHYTVHTVIWWCLININNYSNNSIHHTYTHCPFLWRWFTLMSHTSSTVVSIYTQLDWRTSLRIFRTLHTDGWEFTIYLTNDIFLDTVAETELSQRLPARHE